jgi:hypothetical protein
MSDEGTDDEPWSVEVEVFFEGSWHRGVVVDRRRDDDRWLASVDVTLVDDDGPLTVSAGWFDMNSLRPVQPDEDG